MTLAPTLSLAYNTDSGTQPLTRKWLMGSDWDIILARILSFISKHYRYLIMEDKSWQAPPYR